MPIEFGILREGSETTLRAESRVCLDENAASEGVSALLQKLAFGTGETLDEYESASLAGSSLRAFIANATSLLEESGDGSHERRRFLEQLVELSSAASQQNIALSYFGH